jgi:ATP-dependent helicase/DNAse subunit B
LIYNTESEGFDAGEKSRFITQLEFENHPNHIFTHEIFNAVMPKVAVTPRIILKSESVINRLHEISEAGFSPSALTSYMRNPMAFYFERILRIRDFEEVEETIAANTLGTIIHETLRVFYKPYEGKLITENVLRGFLQLIDDEVRHQFKLIYKEGEINKGRNLLAFEVAKRHLHNFINKELQSIEQGEIIKILAIETTFQRWLHHPSLPCPILIKGNVDRIEERNGVVRIIDYKTGKVEKRNMLLKTWNGLTKELKNDKIIQVLA